MARGEGTLLQQCSDEDAQDKRENCYDGIFRDVTLILRTYDLFDDGDLFDNRFFDVFYDRCWLLDDPVDVFYDRFFDDPVHVFDAFDYDRGASQYSVATCSQIFDIGIQHLSELDQIDCIRT